MVNFLFLTGHFITEKTNLNHLQNGFVTFLESIRNGDSSIEDQNSFEWGGTICFRNNHVMILDKSILQVGRLLP